MLVAEVVWGVVGGALVDHAHGMNCAPTDVFHLHLEVCAGVLVGVALMG